MSQFFTFIFCAIGMVAAGCAVMLGLIYVLDKLEEHVWYWRHQCGCKRDNKRLFQWKRK